MLVPLAGGSSTVVNLGELMMILELHRQGLKVSAIARQLGVDRKTVRKYIARGLEPPAYGPRPVQQKSTDPFLPYLQDRLAAFPGLTAVRLCRELRERGYVGGYTAVKRAVREIRPTAVTPFEVRFETPPGEQAQVDLARFEVEFTDEPGVTRIVWLFSMVLGYSRLIWARFVVHQDLQSVLRCHIAALEAIGGSPREILYDRMKTAVIGEDPDGLVIYNRALLDLARHYGFQPRACRPTARRPRARLSVHSATFARTSFLVRHSAILMISTPSFATGWIRSPIRAFTRPRSASSTRPSPKNDRHSGRCRLLRIAPC
jgi:transposase